MVSFRSLFRRCSNPRGRLAGTVGTAFRLLDSPFAQTQGHRTAALGPASGFSLKTLVRLPRSTSLWRLSPVSGWILRDAQMLRRHTEIVLRGRHSKSKVKRAARIASAPLTRWPPRQSGKGAAEEENVEQGVQAKPAFLSNLKPALTPEPSGLSATCSLSSGTASR